MCHICAIYVTYIYGMCAIAMSDKATIKGPRYVYAIYEARLIAFAADISRNWVSSSSSTDLVGYKGSI